MRETPLHATPIRRARLVSPVAARAYPLSPKAPALGLMTDFATEGAHAVEADRRIDDALYDMVVFGVRLLLVVRDDEVIGTVTSYDIRGERPAKILEVADKDGPHKPAEVTVGDILTPINAHRLLRLEWVEVSTVGDVAALFRGTRDTHLLVTQDELRGGVVIRGLFSRRRLERQIGGVDD